MFLKQKEGQEIVLSEKWKSTGEPYYGYHLDASDDLWITESNRDFLVSLHKTAAETNAYKKRSQKDAEDKILEKVEEGKENDYKPFSEVMLAPELFDVNTPDKIVFIQIRGHFVSNAKYFSQAIVSGVLTSGALAVAQGSGAKASIVVYDRSKNQILWNNSFNGTNANAIKNAITFALKPYPDVNGHSPRQRKKTRYSRAAKSQ